MKKSYTSLLACLIIYQITAQDIAIQEVLYNSTFGNDKFELVNTTANQTIDISGWWLCAQFVYRNLGDATSIQILEGSLMMEPGSRIKMRILNMDLAIESDFGIYTSPDFGNPAAMHDFIQWGTESPFIGRGIEAITKGIWRDMDMVAGSPYVVDSIPRAAAGLSTNWDGTNSGPGEQTWSSDFTNSLPSLPIQLLTLNGKVNVDKYVELEWITIEEFNSNKHFIETSMNGQDYEVIGEVNSQNLGSAPAYYSFLDETPVMDALNYYRIRQLDNDGHELLSPPLFINVKNVPNHRMVFSPMPITGIGCFSMEFYWPRDEGLAEFKIVGMSGNIVDSFSESVQEGYNNLIHQFYGIEPGQYIMVLSDDKGEYCAQSFLIAK